VTYRMADQEITVIIDAPTRDNAISVIEDALLDSLDNDETQTELYGFEWYFVNAS